MTDSLSRRRRPLPLAYRRRSHDQFVTEMIRELVGPRLGDSPALALGTRAIDDPTVALIDAWAAVAEVVQFYQDRIAAESFLATAVEPESILALASLVGYRPRPGLAATTWLAYTLNPDPNDTAVLLPAGLLVQSVPHTGELPQTFETTDDLVARPSWNTLRLRTAEPLTIPPGGVGALPELLVNGTFTRLTPNDMILIKTADPRPAPVRVKNVVANLITQRTTVTLCPVRSDLPGPAPVQSMAAEFTTAAAIADVAGVPTAADSSQSKALDNLVTALRSSPAPPPAAKPAPDRVDTPGSHLDILASTSRSVVQVQSTSLDLRLASPPSPPSDPHTVPDVATRLSIALRPTLAASLYPALATTQVGEAGVQDVLALRVKAAPFGVQMPSHALDAQGKPLPDERSIEIDGPTVLDLDATYDSIVAGSWVMIDRAIPLSTEGGVTYPVIAQVLAADRVAVNRYGLGLKVTRLRLSEDWIDTNAKFSDLQQLAVYAQSEPLVVLPKPIVDDVTGNQIELDGLFPGIDIGRRLLLTGIRTDLPAKASVVWGETVMVNRVDQILHGSGDTPHTLLTLLPPLRYPYRRDSVQLYGNVVSAHQGATIGESLVATGDDRAHPTFTLAQAPVLADPAPTAAGSVLSLTVTVDGRRWNPVPRLGSSTPPRSYLTGTDHQGHTTITLGEALPYPDSTVTATYRVGHGALGNVRAGQLTQALSRPLAVAGVDNPLPATGGADPVGPDVVRANAPVGLQALARVVSVADAADIALSWAGIGKADAQLCGDGRRQVLAVTVAGVTPEPLEPDAELCINVAAALRASGDPAVPVVVLPAVLSLIMIVAEVSHDPDTGWDTVERAVRAALLDAFGYARRRLGEDVVLSDLVAIAHRVPAVRSFVISGIDVVNAKTTTDKLIGLDNQLPLPPPCGRKLIPSTTSGDLEGAAHVAYLSDLVADTLKLQEHRP